MQLTRHIAAADLSSIREAHRHFRRTGVYYWVSEPHSLIYLSIPKNANSYLRSIFYANNFLDFDPSRESAIAYSRRLGYAPLQLRDYRKLRSSSYSKILVLRDPLKRLVSAYVDKIVKRELAGFYDPWRVSLYKVMSRVLNKAIDARSIIFADFARFVCYAPNYLRDRHWKTQSYYVNGQGFDFYGDVDNMSAVNNFLSRAKMDVDIGPLRSGKRSRYAVKEMIPLPMDCAQLTIAELGEQQLFPQPAYFYDDDLRKCVCNAFACDVDLYSLAKQSEQSERSEHND